MVNVSVPNSISVNKLEPKVVGGNTFQNVYLRMTLSQGQGQDDLETLEKLTFYYFSDTYYSIVLNLHQIVANSKSFLREHMTR